MSEENYKIYLDNGIYDIQDGKYKSAIENINKSLELKSDWEIPYFYRAVAITRILQCTYFAVFRKLQLIMT